MTDLFKLLADSHAVVLVGGKDSRKRIEQLSLAQDPGAVCETLPQQDVRMGHALTVWDDPDYVFYLGHYSEPYCMEAFTNYFFTGMTVVLPIERSFEEASAALRDLEHGEALTIIDGTGLC